MLEHSLTFGSDLCLQPYRGISWRIFNQITGVKIKSIPLGNKSVALSSAGINAAGFLPALDPSSKSCAPSNKVFLLHRSGMDARKDQRFLGAIGQLLFH